MEQIRYRTSSIDMSAATLVTGSWYRNRSYIKSDNPELDDVPTRAHCSMVSRPIDVMTGSQYVSVETNNKA